MGLVNSLRVMPGTFCPSVPYGWQQVWGLADGSQILAPVYRATAQIGEFEPVPVALVALADEYVVGLDVMRYFSVNLDHGARVIVNP